MPAHLPALSGLGPVGHALGCDARSVYVGHEAAAMTLQRQHQCRGRKALPRSSQEARKRLRRAHVLLPGRGDADRPRSFSDRFLALFSRIFGSSVSADRVCQFDNEYS